MNVPVGNIYYDANKHVLIIINHEIKNQEKSGFRKLNDRANEIKNQFSPSINIRLPHENVCFSNSNQRLIKITDAEYNKNV